MANCNYVLTELMIESARRVGRVVRIAPEDVGAGDAMLLKAHAITILFIPASSKEADHFRRVRPAFQRDPTEAF